MAARLEADVAANQSTSLSAQLAASTAAADRLTALWQAAERGRQCLLRGAGQREAQGAAFAVERMHAQVGEQVLMRRLCAWCTVETVSCLGLGGSEALTRMP
jgi:hypothetical protein